MKFFLPLKLDIYTNKIFETYGKWNIKLLMLIFSYLIKNHLNLLKDALNLNNS